MSGSEAEPSPCRARPSAAQPISFERICSAGQPTCLKVDTDKLQIRDGVIASTEDPARRTTFAALAKANQGRHPADRPRRCGRREEASNKGVGACFAEVEVDTWTGDWRFIRAVYPHDTGLVINPLVAEADMVGSLVESTQVTTDAIPWDREFPGTATTA